MVGTYRADLQEVAHAKRVRRVDGGSRPAERVPRRVDGRYGRSLVIGWLLVVFGRPVPLSELRKADALNVSASFCVELLEARELRSAVPQIRVDCEHCQREDRGVIEPSVEGIDGFRHGNFSEVSTFTRHASNVCSCWPVSGSASPVELCE